MGSLPGRADRCADPWAWPRTLTATYGGLQWSTLVFYLVIMAVLLVRPQGLFRRPPPRGRGLEMDLPQACSAPASGRRDRAAGSPCSTRCSIRGSPYPQGVMLARVSCSPCRPRAGNIVSGYAGYISLGHSMFLGLGAYTAAIVALHTGINPFWVAPLGGITAVLVAIVFGSVVLRTRGHAFRHHHHRALLPLRADRGDEPGPRSPTDPNGITLELAVSGVPTSRTSRSITALPPPAGADRAVQRLDQPDQVRHRP